MWRNDRTTFPAGALDPDRKCEWRTSGGRVEMMKTPRGVVNAWVDAFNRADVDDLAKLYAEDAVNHQVAEAPIRGRAQIRAMFEREFAAASMTCIMENLFEDGDWAILEWRDPLGHRGCGFLQVASGRIIFQRGYWDKLTFLRLHGSPLPTAGCAAKVNEQVARPWGVLEERCFPALRAFDSARFCCIASHRHSRGEKDSPEAGKTPSDALRRHPAHR
jgi:limonene-1,2-epoxide hydrolase